MARRPNSQVQEYFSFAFDHVQVTADTLIQLMTAQRAMRVDAVQYINVTGLAASATDYFNIKLQKGSTIMANWSTQTSAQGAIAADTFVSPVLSSTDANLVAAAGDVLKLNLDETGTQTLPAGHIVVHGRYV